MKQHDRQFFYKYCTAETLKAILTNKRFRWSAPMLFNDPFDHLFQISMDGAPQDLKPWFIAECKRFVFGYEEPKVLYPVVYTNLLYMLRNNSNKFQESELIEEWSKGFDEGIVAGKNRLNEYNKMWEEITKEARVFCVTEEPNNFLMWAHYAGEHSGAVIEKGMALYCQWEREGIIF
jgi:hypothetical protein